MTHPSRNSRFVGCTEYLIKFQAVLNFAQKCIHANSFQLLFYRNRQKNKKRCLNKN